MSTSSDEYWIDEEALTETLMPSFHNDPDFIEYRKKIEKLMKRAKKTFCTRDVHLALGDFNMHWTLDAIETSKEIVNTELSILPDRFAHHKFLDKLCEEVHRRREHDLKQKQEARGNNHFLFAGKNEEREERRAIPYGAYAGSKDR